MAIKLEDKPGVQAPNAAYPFGRPKDNSGSNDGMPLNVLTHGDFHQFFAKMMDDAAISYNGLPDNATDGFQYFIAFVESIKKYANFNENIASSINIGSSFSAVIKEVKKYKTGTVFVNMQLAHVGTLASNELILSGFPITRTGLKIIRVVDDYNYQHEIYKDAVLNYFTGELRLAESISNTNTFLQFSFSFKL